MSQSHQEKPKQSRLSDNPKELLYNRYRAMKITLIKLGLAFVVVLLVSIIIYFLYIREQAVPDFLRQTEKLETPSESGESMETVKNEQDTQTYVEKNQQAMTDPKFYGTDSKERPYTIEAKRVQQVNASDSKSLPDNTTGSLKIEDLEAKLFLSQKKESAIYLRAMTGFYDEQSEELELTDKVTFSDEQGYRLITNFMRVDLDAGHAQTDRRVIGMGPRAGIRSEGLKILDKGTKIIFTGPVTLVIRASTEDQVKESQYDFVPELSQQVEEFQPEEDF